MAGEITTNSATLTASNGGATVNSGTKAKALDMDSVHMAKFTQAIGTSAEAIAIPSDLSAYIEVLIVNLDDTNFVTIAKEVGITNVHSKLLPGNWCKLAFKAKSELYAISDTTACNIEVTCCSISS